MRPIPVCTRKSGRLSDSRESASPRDTLSGATIAVGSTRIQPWSVHKNLDPGMGMVLFDDQIIPIRIAFTTQIPDHNPCRDTRRTH